MTGKPTPDNRRGDRRVRQVYHDVERRDGTDRRREPDKPAGSRDQSEFSPLPWLVIAVIAFLLIDTFVWDGAYFHAFRVTISADISATQAWADRAWQ